MLVDISQEFKDEEIAALIASEDDSSHRQLRVTKAGIAYVCAATDPFESSELAFRLETWSQGNDYSGGAASEDFEFVARVAKALRENWPYPSAPYIDYY